MDDITKTLHSFLVTMAYEGATHEQEHQMEHLLSLLEPADEQTVVSYYGLFDEPRLSLDEIAHGCRETPEQAMADIDRLLRRMAVSPEWQMMSEKVSQ